MLNSVTGSRMVVTWSGGKEMEDYGLMGRVSVCLIQRILEMDVAMAAQEGECESFVRNCTLKIGSNGHLYVCLFYR